MKQKEKIGEARELAEMDLRKEEEDKELKKIEDNAKKIVQFEKYDNFENLGDRKKFVSELITNP
jgi:hypothetical protein